MKHAKLWVPFLCLFSCVIALLVATSRQNIKDSTISYIQSNHQNLEIFAEEIMKSGTAPSVYNGWDVTYYPEAEMIQFDVRTDGFSTSSTYEGFYYSHNDVPHGFQGANIEFHRSGVGWEWTDPIGDNYAYTEQIIKKWYWFEMHF